MGVMSSWRRSVRRPARVGAVKRHALAAALLCVFALPGVARGELVPGSSGAQDSLLAVAADGSPLVSFVDASGTIELATRTVDGVWTVAPLPLGAGSQALVGLAVTTRGVTLLVEATGGAWLRLAEQTASGWRVRTVATAPKGGSLGFGGLAVDRSGGPLVAYPTLLRSRKTALRLVREDAAGRLVGEAITREGFPKSNELPAAAPVVLPNGALRVIEVYSGAAIAWARTKRPRGWSGQFIYANSLGQPAGTVHAIPGTAGAVWSAWTELFPSSGESHVVLADHAAESKATVLSRHGFVIGLAAGPEVAGDDYLDLEGGRTVYAGLVLDASGETTELAGNLEGYALEPGGSRDYLLLDAAGLSWYRAPSPPSTTVTLSAGVSGASFVLTGRVAGVSAGSVELWRETQAGSELAATVPLAADGTFGATDTPPVRPLTYRAVYRDPVSQLPLAALLRDVLGG